MLSSVHTNNSPSTIHRKSKTVVRPYANSNVAVLKYPNRIAEFRARIRPKPSQDVLGQACGGWSQDKISKLEKGDSQLKMADARKLAAAITRFGVPCGTADLMGGESSHSLPITLAIAAFESEDAPDVYDLTEPCELIQAPRGLKNTTDCFVAIVHDDSADRTYAPGSTLVVRRLPGDGTELAPGAEVIVRRYTKDRAGGTTMEVLVGFLDRAITGDLIVLLRSSNRRVPDSVIVQRATPSGATISEPMARFLVRQEKIEYRPRDDDPAEILGEVVFATVPRQAAMRALA